MFTFYKQDFRNYLERNFKQKRKYKNKIRERNQQNSVLKVFINNEH